MSPENAMVHFLLVYDLKQRQLRSCQSYSEVAEATEAYSRLEEQHRGDEAIQIVLVGADSIETIHVTHGHYFASEDLLAPYLGAR